MSTVANPSRKARYQAAYEALERDIKHQAEKCGNPPEGWHAFLAGRLEEVIDDLALRVPGVIEHLELRYHEGA